MSESIRRKLDDSYIEHYKDLNVIDEEAYKKHIKNYHDQLSAVLPENKEASMVDIGCGVGLLLYYLSQMGYTSLTGVDSSKSQLEMARKFCPSFIKLINDDANNFLLYNKAKFDRIFLFDFIEHIEKDSIIPFLIKIYDALKPLGRAIIRTPNMASPSASYSRYIDFLHEVGFTEYSLKQVLYATPFKDNVELVRIAYSTISLLHRAVKRAHDLLYRFLYKVNCQSLPTTFDVNLIIIAKKS